MEYQSSTTEMNGYPGMYDIAYQTATPGADPLHYRSYPNGAGNGSELVPQIYHGNPQQNYQNHAYNASQHYLGAVAQAPKSDATNESAEILDLDSYKVHVYQPPGAVNGNSNGGPVLVPTPPYTPAASVGSSSNSSSMGWMTPTPPLPSLVAPVQHETYGHSELNPFHGYEMFPQVQNSLQPNQAPYAQTKLIQMAPSTLQNPVNWKPPVNQTGNMQTGNNGTGIVKPGSAAGEARRPKTYNCEVCNKWFTSSGHLKRHFNTTLHRNALRSNGANSSESGEKASNAASKAVPSPAISEDLSSECKTDPLSPMFSNSQEADTYRPPPKVTPVANHQLGYPAPPLPVNIDQYNPQYHEQISYGSSGLVPRRVENNGMYLEQHVTPLNGGYSTGFLPNEDSSYENLSETGYGASHFPNQGSNPMWHRQGEVRKTDPASDASSASELSMDNGCDLEDGSDAESDRAQNAKNGGASARGGEGDGTFKCAQCDKAFNRVCYLTQHNNTFHKGDKPFKCHMCGKRFQNSELFDQHQQKHAGDKPYKCSLCPKQFNHKTDLRRHMCLHTGQKPFLCQICNKGFIRKDHMVKHVQTHTRRNASAAMHPA